MDAYRLVMGVRPTRFQTRRLSRRCSRGSSRCAPLWMRLRRRRTTATSSWTSLAGGARIAVGRATFLSHIGTIGKHRKEKAMENSRNEKTREFLDEFCGKFEPALRALAAPADEEVNLSELERKCAEAEKRQSS